MLDTIQASIKAALAAKSEFAGLALLVELDDDATPEQLAAQDQEYETAITTQGYVVTIGSPRTESINQVRGAGLHARLIVQVGFIEVPVVNRSETGAKKKTRALIRKAIQALLKVGFEFPSQFLTHPEDVEGVFLHGLLVYGKDDIRAE